MSELQQKATLGVRLISFVIFVIHLTWLIGNLLLNTGLEIFAYFGYFLATQVARPVLGMAVALLLWLLSKRLGKCLAKQLD